MRAREKEGRRMNAFKMMSLAFVLFACFSLLPGTASAAQKPRVVVMTDIGGDPDDQQSMVRFLLYTCDFDVEGLCTGFGHGHYEKTRPDLIRKAVDAYGKVLPSLKKHRPDYPSHEHLVSLIKDGHNGDPHRVGAGMDSQASEWIIKVLDRDDPRPVWFSIWGGPRELAQKRTRTFSHMRKIWEASTPTVVLENSFASRSTKTPLETSSSCARQRSSPVGITPVTSRADSIIIEKTFMAPPFLQIEHVYEPEPEEHV